LRSRANAFESALDGFETDVLVESTSMTIAQAQSKIRDEEQLSLLGTFHYVVAGLQAVFGVASLMNLTMGLAMLRGEISRLDRSTPGIDGTAVRAAEPSWPNIGSIKSSGVTFDSRVSRRAHSSAGLTVLCH
jgi:hypothetical protein